MTRRVDDNMVSGRRADELMRRAVALASETWPHPNPRVGAIVVSADGRILSERGHLGPGSAHAEAAALEAAGDAARGGTLVVTLEPCTHHGRTAPCVAAVLDAGVARVVIGVPDPDERVSGAGIQRLRDAGIETITGVAAPIVHDADPGYFHHRRTGRPRVVLKAAMTLDGQVAAQDGTSKWITGPDARRDAHRLRSRADAVMVGAGTVRVDDPRLDVRLDGYSGPQPRPVVIAGRQPLPDDARVLRRHPIVYVPEAGAARPVEVELVASGRAEAADLGFVMKDLGARGIVDLLVEGGPTLAAGLLDAGLVDALVMYVGGVLAGGVGIGPFSGAFPSIAGLHSVTIGAVERLGSDLRIDAVLAKEAA